MKRYKIEKGLYSVSLRTLPKVDNHFGTMKPTTHQLMDFKSPTQHAHCTLRL